MTIETPNPQITSGDSVVVIVTDTDVVTGLVVTPDIGSLTLASSKSDDVITANADGTFTLTAGPTQLAGNTLSANATVDGVPSDTAVAPYDVVAAVAPADATALSIEIGVEAPSGETPSETPATQFNQVTGNWESVK